MNPEVNDMAGTKNEIVGGIKEGLGKLTGNEGLETEGTIQKTGGRTQRKASGASHEVKGHLKSAAGKVIDSPTLKAEGEIDKARGKIERS